MPRKPKQSDIAKMAGVSVSSVSRVLNGDPGVKPEKREAVLQAMRETGYRQNPLLYGPAQGQPGSKTIGLVLPNLCNPFFAQLAAGIQDELLERGYLLSVFNTYFDPARERHSLALLRESAAAGATAGLIISSCLTDSEAEHGLRDLHCPITLLDRALEAPACNSVIQDNFQAGYQAAKHLLELGHRDILFLAGVPNSRSSMDRVEGYRKALESAFIPVDEGRITCGEMGLGRGEAAARAWLELPQPRPTAVIAANDETAIGFMDACRHRGVRIPGDLSVVGFDDIAIAALNGVSLTTVHQSIGEMVKSAVEATLLSVEDPAAASVRKLLLQPQLVVRRSTAATGTVPA